MVTAICGGTALLFLLMVWSGGVHYKEVESLQWLEFYTQDKRAVLGVKTPVDPRLVLIGIDKTEYSDFTPDEIAANPTLKFLRRPYPWPRAVWADLITRLADGGAKVIVLDLYFGAEGDGDDALKQALDKYKDRVVIGSNLHDLASDRGDTLNLDLPNPSVINYADPNAPTADKRVGYVNIWPDWDGVLRMARYHVETPLSTPGMESLDARALRQFGAANLIPPGTEPVRFRYTGWAGAGYPAISLGDVLGPKTWKQNFGSGQFFRGKIVFVGPTSSIFQDAHLTPFPDRDITVDGATVHGSRMMSGPEIHLNMIGAALNRKFLRDASLNESLMIVLLAGLIATSLSFSVHQPLRRLGLILLLSVIYWYAAQWLFDHANLVVPVASPLLVLIISGVFVLTYDYFVQQFERTRVRRTLERYVSKDLVKELLDNPATFFHTLGGVRRPVTVLFSDLRGFTTLAESADSAQLVKQLNEYFAEMTPHVFNLQGTLDKFIGDAIMAVWGNVVTQGREKDAQHAVATALRMKSGLARLNADWKTRGMPALSLGIGINHGEVIVGNLGSAEKMEMTVIGDAVNLASRLEGLTKYFHTDLLIGETVAPLVREKFVLRTVGLIQPKGKTKPVEVFTVLGERGANEKVPSWLVQHEDAVKLFRERKFGPALKLFGYCHALQPDDYLSGRYAAECEALLKETPGENWNGVFVMSEK